MSWFFFHLCDGGDTLFDEEGRELGSEVDIHRVALIEARGIISDEAKSGVINLSFRIDVEDEAPTIVHSLGFQEAVQIVL